MRLNNFDIELNIPQIKSSVIFDFYFSHLFKFSDLGIKLKQITVKVINAADLNAIYRFDFIIYMLYNKIIRK